MHIHYGFYKDGTLNKTLRDHQIEFIRVFKIVHVKERSMIFFYYSYKLLGNIDYLHITRNITDVIIIFIYYVWKLKICVLYPSIRSFGGIQCLSVTCTSFFFFLIENIRFKLIAYLILRFLFKHPRNQSPSNDTGEDNEQSRAEI